MSKCLECGYYDKEKHYCPFYCQLIRETLNEAISFELEKIKGEIDDLQKTHHIWLIDQNALIDECSEIIDKHISELKGEQK